MGLNLFQIKCIKWTKSPTTRAERFLISRVLAPFQVKGQIKLSIAWIIDKLFPNLSETGFSSSHYSNHALIFLEGCTTFRYKIYFSLFSNSPSSLLFLCPSIPINLYFFFLSFRHALLLLLASHFPSLFLPMIKYMCFINTCLLPCFCPSVLTTWKV